MRASAPGAHGKRRVKGTWSCLVATAMMLVMSGCAYHPAAPGAATATRTIAITFDDLPTVGVVGSGAAAEKAMTASLLRAIQAHRVPAIGFVNEGKLYPDAGTTPDPDRLALLRDWMEAGLELGNHTYSHLSMHKIPASQYGADILRGEVHTRPLMAAYGKQLRYFRHPFLHAGVDAPTRTSIDDVLARGRYQVAPVTIDNDEYLFAAAYGHAAPGADKAMQDKVAQEYIGYMEATTAYYEKQSQSLFGREIPQVLLLHANQINADRFDGLAAMLAARGYRFVPLEAAMADPAYRSVDSYRGPRGISWLHRWALSKGGAAAITPGEPAVPKWIAELAQPGQ